MKTGVRAGIFMLAAGAVALTALPAEALPHRVGTRSSVQFAARAWPARRGRPRKFGRPSRAVTLTLPEDVISALESVDNDLSRAVVRAVLPFVASRPGRSAELVNYGANAVIVVPPTAALCKRLGVDLIPFADGRALISFDDGLTAAQIELRLGDALADQTLTGSDRMTFEELAAILRTVRREETALLRQRNIIVFERQSGS